MKFLAITGCIALTLCRAFAGEPPPLEKFAQGIAQFRHGEYSQALSTFGSVQSSLKQSGEFNYYYGLSLLKTHQPGPAIDSMKRAIGIDPRNADYHFALGLSYAARMSELSLMRAALLMRSTRETLVTAVALNPGHVGATMALAEFLLDVPSATGSGRQQAKELLNRLRTLDAAAAALLEAKMEGSRNNPGRVEQLLLRAVETPGSTPVARLRLAKFYVDQKAYAQAIRYSREYLDMPKAWSESAYDTTYAHLWLAVAYHGLGDTVNSRAHVQAVDTARLPHRLRHDVQRVLEDAGMD